MTPEAMIPEGMMTRWWGVGEGAETAEMGVLPRLLGGGEFP